MGDNLIMSRKERQRKAILELILNGHITRLDGAKRLGISYRQIKRIIACYLKEGDAGLVHKNRGKPSGCAYSAEKKQKIIKLYEEKYMDFGPTFAAEKLLEEDGMEVNPETLRLWLKSCDLWKSSRKRKQHRSRRARRQRYGEMLQLDGSIHSWFDGVDKKQCLMNMVDDATGRTLALMDDGETTRAAFSLLKWWIINAGVPLSIYVDLKSLYVSPKSLKQKEEDGEELIEVEWLTHFSKACKKLGIKIIRAYSAQAKGRVERNHGVYQDRFVKELKLKNIKTIEEANEFLSNGFVNKLNDKFAKAASDSQDAHISLSADNDLDQILCWEYERQIKNDWTVQLNNQHYQIHSTNGLKPQQKILMRKHLNESVSLWGKGKCLDFSAIEARPKKEEAKPVCRNNSVRQAEISRKNKHKTPWNKFKPDWLSSPKKKRSGRT